MSLKYIELKQQKKKEKKNETTKTALSSSQRGTNIQYKSILFKKRVEMKMQQNRDINALLKSGRCRVF